MTDSCLWCGETELLVPRCAANALSEFYSSFGSLPPDGECCDTNNNQGPEVPNFSCSRISITGHAQAYMHNFSVEKLYDVNTPTICGEITGVRWVLELDYNINNGVFKYCPINSNRYPYVPWMAFIGAEEVTEGVNCARDWELC